MNSMHVTHMSLNVASSEDRFIYRCAKMKQLLKSFCLYSLNIDDVINIFGTELNLLIKDRRAYNSIFELTSKIRAFLQIEE